MTRSMLKAKGLLGWFWGEAVNTAVHILNRCPTKSVTGMTPFEAWYGKKTVCTPPEDVWLHRVCEEHDAAPEQA
jgi:hypothetical protein